MSDYKELIVWQKSMNLAKDIYTLCKTFPSDEKFGLTSQIKRSAVSIPSNIAEGSGRSTSKDFAQFISIAIGSACELETQIILGIEFGFIQSDCKVLSEIEPIRKMLYSLRTSLRK